MDPHVSKHCTNPELLSTHLYFVKYCTISPFASLFSSVADPDPHRFGQLDPDPHWEYGSGSRRAKMTHKSKENSNFEVLDVFFQV
jgi:hypothetical protein